MGTWIEGYDPGLFNSSGSLSSSSSHTCYTKADLVALLERIEKEVPERKKPVAEWDGGETYDTEKDEGYNQAVDDFNKKLSAIKDSL